MKSLNPAFRVPTQIAVWLAWILLPLTCPAQQAPPVEFTIRIPDSSQKTAEIQAIFPVAGHDSIEVAMPVWSPGFYFVQNYAEQLSDFHATTEDGKPLELKQSQSNRWTISTNQADRIVLSYRVKCERCSVTTNWVEEGFAVFNGCATFVFPVGGADRPFHVRLDLPDQWQVFTGLESVPAADSKNTFVAPDYDTLVDSPIIAGKNLGVHEFEVAGTRHVLVDAGNATGWDGEKAAANLAKLVQGMHDFWGHLPFQRYVFLNTLNNGGGGLEHKNSTLISTRFNPNATDQAPWSAFRWLAFVSHEYFHSFNVKRLRPIELGPFDYERPPRTSGLWIAEGLTSYYGDLIAVRSGLGTPTDFLASMSSYIRQLQNSPGRLQQTLENASLDVWTGGMSGVNQDRDKRISYYIKGPIVGFLLDAKIRKATGGAKSLDDVMRLAYQRYSGDRGFTPSDFVAVAEEVSGTDLDEWFHRHLSTTEELDYAPALEWFGLQLSDDPDPKIQWSLTVRSDATEKQREEFRSLTGNQSPSPHAAQ